MRHKAKPGSVLIMVLSITTVVMFLAIAALRSSSYGLDIALERMKLVQQQSATEGLMRYALACAQEHYDAILKEPNSIVMTVDKWMKTPESSLYQGRIEIDNTEPLAVRVALMHANIACSTLSCVLHRTRVEEKNQFLVSNWTIHVDDHASTTH